MSSRVLIKADKSLWNINTELWCSTNLVTQNGFSFDDLDSGAMFLIDSCKIFCLLGYPKNVYTDCIIPIEFLISATLQLYYIPMLRQWDAQWIYNAIGWSFLMCACTPLKQPDITATQCWAKFYLL